MKKIILGITITLSILLVSGVVVAGNPWQDELGSNAVFIKDDGVGHGLLKNVLNVRHNFNNGFTVNVTPNEMGLLNLLGVETEPVLLYQITGKPVCGNNIIEGGEKCGEDGLPGCPTGFTCENCKCVEGTVTPPPPERSCYPSTQAPWGIARVNGGSGGVGVKVAVLDTGVYKDHLDLKANIVDCKDATKRGIRDGCTDSNGHGTHVAGTILADGGADELGILGVAPQAKLMAIKVCGPRGCYTDDIAEGIIYAADAGANIISMSLGGDTESSLIKDAIDYAVGEKGVLIVAAAGNDGPKDVSIDYPGANVNVVAVGAIDSAENVPSWSSRGVNDGDYIIEEREVEFGAPGVSVESTYKNGCYALKSGTSMATPHVAGLAAKLWQGTADATRTYLHTIAKDIWDDGDDTATGFGLPITPQQ